MYFYNFEFLGWLISVQYCLREEIMTYNVVCNQAVIETLWLHFEELKCCSSLFIIKIIKHVFEGEVKVQEKFKLHPEKGLTTATSEHSSSQLWWLSKLAAHPDWWHLGTQWNLTGQVKDLTQSLQIVSSMWLWKDERLWAHSWLAGERTTQGIWVTVGGGACVCVCAYTPSIQFNFKGLFEG